MELGGIRLIPPIVLKKLAHLISSGNNSLAVGNLSALVAKTRKPKAIIFRSFIFLASLALDTLPAKLTLPMVAKTPIILITTISSTRVNPILLLIIVLNFLIIYHLLYIELVMS